MEIKPDFQRTFLIFVNEDTGYESVQRPSGHIKIEVREGRGKLWASVQNLLENVRFDYRLYLLNTTSGRSEPVHVGLLELKRNKGALEWEFNPLNVANTGLRIENFEVAAILVEYRDRENTSIICPLAAYRGKKTPWRNSLAERQYIKKAQKETPTNEYIGNINKVMPVEEYIAPEIPVPQPEQPILHNAEAEENQEPLSFQQNVQQNVQQTVQQTEYQNVDTGLNTACLYLNSNMCGSYVNTGAANPCMGCTMHKQPEPEPETVDNRENAGGIERLRMELDNNFERYDPFHVKRSDYSWWKVTNPVNLNNILYQCNIRSPLLFNPAVMMSHFKYRHLIIGICTDRARGREYVVCGVFGMHMVDRKPFGDMCKWVQTEGTKLKYGAFGYWIVYLDPETGKILSLK